MGASDWQRPSPVDRQRSMRRALCLVLLVASLVYGGGERRAVSPQPADDVAPVLVTTRQKVAVANLCIATACGLALEDWTAGLMAAGLLFGLSHCEPQECALLAIW